MAEPLTIDQVCSEVVDCVNRTAPETLDGQYFAVGTPAMRGNVINLLEARRLSAETFATWTRRLLPKAGDLFLAREAPVGPVVRIPDGGRIAAGQRVMHLRANPSVVHELYLFYLLISPDTQAKLISIAMGSTVPHLRVADVKSFTLPPLPPLGEQRAIAEVLGALDDKIDANHRIETTANALGDALFKSVVAASDAIVRVSIRDLAGDGVLTYGDGYRTKRSEHGQPGLRIVRAGDIKSGRIVLSGDDFVSNDYVGQIGVKICRPKDIVLTTKGTVGRVAVVPDDISSSVYSPQLCYFRVAEDHGRIQPWLAAWFRSSDRIRQTDIAMHKSDMAPYVNLQDIGSLVVPIMDLDAFGSTVEQLGSLQSLGHAVTRENVALARTRDELLPLLMSGKLRVKDAEKKVEEMV